MPDPDVVVAVVRCHRHLQQKQFSESQKLNSLGVLLYSSLGTLPTALAMAVLVGEMDTLMDFPYLWDFVRLPHVEFALVCVQEAAHDLVLWVVAL